MARNNTPCIEKVFLYLIFGIVLLVFLAIYGSRLYFGYFTAMHGINFLIKVSGRQGATAVHIVVFMLFLLLLQIRYKTDWRSSGMFAAFMISLFTEMFGSALFVYLFSNRIFNYPSWENPGGPFWKLTTAAYISRFLGAWLILLNLLLIFYSWYHLYKNRGMLVTSGIYSKIRHPQYAGFIGFTFGWLVYWPTLLNLFLWPVLAFAYVLQACREDKLLSEMYGISFTEYSSQTNMFFPKFEWWTKQK